MGDIDEKLLLMKTVLYYIRGIKPNQIDKKCNGTLQN